MSEMTVSEARANLAGVVDDARTRHEPVMLTRHGKRVAAVIDFDDLEELISAAEDLADITEARRSREEMIEIGNAPIPWEDVKADLGLT